jgi:L-fuconolactonase
MNRRQFLHSAAAVAGSCAVPSAVAGNENKPMLPIVDTHQHLWDLGKFRLPWIRKGEPLDRNYVMADYLRATAGLNVVKTIYMEVAVDPAQHDAEAEYVLDLCKRGDNPMTGAVIGGRPGADGFKDYIAKYRGNAHIKGVRQVLHEAGTPPGTCLQDTFVKHIRLLGELGLSFDLCMRPEELTDAAKLVDACPDTRFILDHCGNGRVQDKDRTQWQRDMAAIAQRKNLVCKISGIVASAKPGQWTADDLAPLVRHTAEVFGHDRILFAGDWPVCTRAATFQQWVEALQSIVAGWSEPDQKKLFHDNAVRVYGLKG